MLVQPLQGVQTQCYIKHLKSWENVRSRIQFTIWPCCILTLKPCLGFDLQQTIHSTNTHTSVHALARTFRHILLFTRRYTEEGATDLKKKKIKKITLLRIKEYGKLYGSSTNKKNKQISSHYKSNIPQIQRCLSTFSRIRKNKFV